MNWWILFHCSFSYVTIASCIRWPLSDDLALRIETRLRSSVSSENRGDRDDDFHIDFYVPTDSRTEARENKVMVAKYQFPDGKYIAEAYDSLNNIRISKITLLGEIASGQTPFQQLCFITKLGDTDMLSAESVSRLRQRNSMAVKVAEEDRGSETITFNLVEPLARIRRGWNFLVSKMCSDVNGLYLTEELRNELENSALFTRADQTTARQCFVSNSTGSPCECVLKYCLPWYPCGWKYCDETHSVPATNSSNAKYRCGVRSCCAGRILRFEPTSTRISPFCEVSASGDVC